MSHVRKYASLSLIPAAALLLTLNGAAGQSQAQLEQLREECIAKVRAIYPDNPQNTGAGLMAAEKREDLVRSCIRDGGRVPGTR